MITKSNLDWNKFKVFYHIAKAGSFTEAGHVLHITQSALSRSIQKLEEQIQLKLFIRNSRGVVLTSQGRALFDTVHKMYEEFVQCNVEIQEVKDEAKGSLKIALLRRLMSSQLMQHILNFQKIYPDIQLHLVQYDQVEDFKSLGVEMAIMPAFADNSELIQSSLCTLQQRLYASDAYLKTFGLPQSMADLKAHRIIDFSEQNSFFNTPSKSLSKDIKSFIQPSLYVNSYEEMRGAAQQDLGIALLNVEKKLNVKNNLIEVMPEIVTQEISLHCIYPSYLEKFKRVQLFENYLKEALQSPENFKFDNNLLNSVTNKSSNTKPLAA
ncbi:MAG: LysR family transcriptional regulator [Janthinobacterium lividum]